MAALIIMTFLAVYVMQHLTNFWKIVKKARKLPAIKENPIFGHAFTFLGDLNGKND